MDHRSRILQASTDKLRQPLYDYLMSLKESERGNIFTNLSILDFQEVPEDTPTYWANKALQISGGNQQMFDSIMMASPEYRANEFLLWATLNFDLGSY